MAIYATPTMKRSGVDEVGVDMTVTAGTSATVDPGDVLYIFYGFQVAWLATDGTEVASGHIGLQRFYGGVGLPAYGWGIMNYGMYDETRDMWWYGLVNNATGGTWTFSYGGNTTAALAHHASAATIQTALAGLASLSGSGVTVTGSGFTGDPYWIVFPFTWPATRDGLTHNDASLTGGTVTDVALYATCRGSIPTDPRLSQIGGTDGANSYHFLWNYGDQWRFRLFKSPRQNWTDPELDNPDNVAPALKTGDQRAEEVAYRMTAQNLTTGEVPWVVRDVLIRNPAAVRPMQIQSMWIEPTGDPNAPAIVTKYAMTWEARNIIIDGAYGIPQIQADYTITDGASGVTYPTNSNTWVATDGSVRLSSQTTRTNPALTVVPVTSNHWTSPQANVTPAITDVSARTATTRPWY